MEIDYEDEVGMLVDLIRAEGDPVLRGVPRERLEMALCARYPAADIAAVFERLPEALRQREDEEAMGDHYAEEARRKAEWDALKPAREAAREAYRRVAGFDPADSDLIDYLPY